MYGVGMVVGALLATRVMRRLQYSGTVIALGPVTGFVAATVAWHRRPSFQAPCLRALGFFLLGVGPILWVISTGDIAAGPRNAALAARTRHPPSTPWSYGARPVGAGLGAIVGGLYGSW